MMLKVTKIAKRLLHPCCALTRLLINKVPGKPPGSRKLKSMVY